MKGEKSAVFISLVSSVLPKAHFSQNINSVLENIWCKTSRFGYEQCRVCWILIKQFLSKRMRGSSILFFYYILFYFLFVSPLTRKVQDRPNTNQIISILTQVLSNIYLIRNFFLYPHKRHLTSRKHTYIILTPLNPTFI